MSHWPPVADPVGTVGEAFTSSYWPPAVSAASAHRFESNSRDTRAATTFTVEFASPTAYSKDVNESSASMNTTEADPNRKDADPVSMVWSE